MERDYRRRIIHIDVEPQRQSPTKNNNINILSCFGGCWYWYCSLRPFETLGSSWLSHTTTTEGVSAAVERVPESMLHTNW